MADNSGGNGEGDKAEKPAPAAPVTVSEKSPVVKIKVEDGHPKGAPEIQDAIMTSVAKVDLKAALASVVKSGSDPMSLITSFNKVKEMMGGLTKSAVHDASVNPTVVAQNDKIPLDPSKSGPSNSR